MRRFLLLAAIIVLAIVATGGGPSDRHERPAAFATAASHRSERHAGIEGGDLSEFDQAAAVNASLGVSKVDPWRGAWSAEGTYSGDGANGYARGIFHLSWRPGDRVLYGAGFRLPDGFYDSQQGQVALLRWDNWPQHRGSGDVGGIVIYGSDQRARLVRGRYNGEEVPLGSSFALPEGRWFEISVFQRFSRRHPMSKVRLDGQLVASSRSKNFYNRPIDRIRYGIVAVAAGQQRNGLHLWFDDANEARWK